MADEAPNSTVAGRYATAIFDLAVEMNSLDAVSADFETLKRMIARSPDLARLVRAPVFSREEQRRGMDAVLEKMGADRLTRTFLALLAGKRRMFVLGQIIGAFESLVAKKRGEIRALVTSARPLRDAEIDELKRVLKTKLSREPIIETHVDASLLGGLIVKVGSRMIDSSLRSKLEGMRAAMRGN